MISGSYVLFKKIDANMSLLQYLRPIISSSSIVANNGNIIKAHKNFRIFLTSEKIFDFRNVCFIGKIEFSFEQVLESFGIYKEIIYKTLHSVFNNKNTKCYKDKGFECTRICFKLESKCEIKDLFGYICSNHFRMLMSLRVYIIKDSSLDDIHSSKSRELIYQSIVNVFLKHDSKLLKESLMLSPQPITLPNMLFAKTEPVESTLKSIIMNINNNKPTLLVGDTGAGKTALVQYLHRNSEYFFNRKTNLKIINMSSDFDGTDLIGGYQSIDFDKKIKELYKREKIEMPKITNKKQLLEYLLEKNTSLKDEIGLYLKMLGKRVPFFYKEGVLTQAMRNGDWILLDEINLCSEESLNLIEAVLSKLKYNTCEENLKNNKIVIYENGEEIKIHENFMIFACMNPHGDFGKKKYESNVFNTLFFYDFSYNLKDIKSVIQSISRNKIEQIDKIASFYYEIKQNLSNKQLTNIIEPLVTGRTLCRAINLILEIGEDKMYYAFNLLFFTQFDISSRSIAIQIYKRIFSTEKNINKNEFVIDNNNINGFIVTEKVKIYLRDVELGIRSNIPILLQGDTSTGKTGLIMALSSKYNKKVLRINNHEHTESGDYIRNYITDKNGIKFREGVLITALRNGYWIILDELNLAPSDVLEVLNRLLDDNREIYVPEIDETIKPHPDFRLLATQNINYVGRQGLAKSFRNRFIEIFFYEKSEAEIKEILETSCKLPASFIKYMMGVYSTLKTERSFNSLITLRDLFKWAKRQPKSYFEVYEIGLDIIVSRQRSKEDIEKIMAVFGTVFQD